MAEPERARVDNQKGTVLVVVEELLGRRRKRLCPIQINYEEI
jgi:hypothetical protein